MRVALVSREVAPVVAGGIGRYVQATANLLSRHGAEVSVVAPESLGDALAKRGARRAFEDKVALELVPEPAPGQAGGYFSYMHRYSANVLGRLRELWPGGAPDIIEFPDYLGEAAVTVQAARCHDPWLRKTSVLVRLHTSAEICSVLNGYVDDAFETRATWELERYALRYADRLLVGGGDVLTTYQRFYRFRLADASVMRHPVGSGWPPVAPRDDDGVFRLLYLGRFERRKGVVSLVRALTGIPGDHWSLTLAGGDTDTAPLGHSMRRQLELLAAGDERIIFHDAVPHQLLPALLANHDALVVPSRWECWPYVALEALQLNRPLIATPVGGLTEMVGQGRAGGRLAAGTSHRDLAALLEPLLAAPETLRSEMVAGKPRAHFRSLVNDEEIVSGYHRLLDRSSEAGTTVRRSAPALVSVVVPYFQLHRYVEEAVESALSQTWRHLEVIVVNDGSFGASDGVLERMAQTRRIRLVSQPNSGLGAARNFGIRVSQGRYIVPLDADNALETEFVERCVDVLEADRTVGFVTSWTLYVDEDGHLLSDRPAAAADDGTLGFQPLGNAPSLVETDNVAGDAVATIRRRLFDLGYWYNEESTSYEDWLLYRELHRAGHVGHAIPERLIRYRVRRDSMLRDIGLPKRARLFGEMQAHVREREVAWTSSND